jgi:uncharacterized lipoprotein YbaY
MRNSAKLLISLAFIVCAVITPGALSACMEDAQSEPAGPVLAMVAKSDSTPSSFKLELSYAQKLLVPRGSALTIHIHDATGKMVFTRKTTTANDAPPYFIDVAFNNSVTYPLKVDARLVSRIGHQFSETVQINQTDVQEAKPVEIRMSPR